MYARQANGYVSACQCVNGDVLVALEKSPSAFTLGSSRVPAVPNKRTDRPFQRLQPPALLTLIRLCLAHHRHETHPSVELWSITLFSATAVLSCSIHRAAPTQPRRRGNLGWLHNPVFAVGRTSPAALPTSWPHSESCISKATWLTQFWLLAHQAFEMLLLGRCSTSRIKRRCSGSGW